MQQEALVASCQYVVNKFLVQFCTQCTGRERHGFTTLEDGTSVRHGECRYFAPDRTNLCRLTTIQTQSFIENTTTHSITHHITIIACGLGMLLLKVVSRKVGVSGIVCFKEVGQYLVESILACMLLQRLLVYLINRLVKLVLDLLAKLLIVNSWS